MSTAFLLSTLWLTLRPASAVEHSNAVLQAVLSIALAGLLLLSAEKNKAHHSSIRMPWALGLASLVIFILGKIFSVNQIQWLAIIAMSYACLYTGLPTVRKRELLKVVFLLYWANPLPGAIFLPLQVFMQKASVTGAEYLLQAFNVRVWADGLIIRTGFKMYEIPAWCSGMRTATALLILSLGVGFHKRLPAVKLMIFTFLALLQGLLLNIIRIALVVLLAPVMGDPTGFNILHDSSGILLIAALFLIIFELQLWSRKRKHTSPEEADKQRYFRLAFSEFPEFWNRISTGRPTILVGLILALGLAAFAYRCRPYHRSEMIKSVAESLRDSGEFNAAYRAADRAYRLQPEDDEWNLTRIRILILGGKYEKTLSEIEKHFQSYLNPSNERWGNTAIEIAILRAYSLIGLKQYEKAASIMDVLPEYAKKKGPLVAMVLTEIGFFLDKVDQVAEHIVPASKWEPNARRVRSLFPYLRSYREWQSIVNADRFVSKHSVPVEAFCAMEAAMNLDDTPRVAEQIENALHKWPMDHRILEPLYFMVLRHDVEKWETRFEEHFLRCLPVVSDPELIFSMLKKAFQLYRADLAWTAYIQLCEKFPNHPYCYMAPGYYGQRWFYLKTTKSRVKGSYVRPYTDLRPFILISMMTPQLNHLTRGIPLKENILSLHKTSTRTEYIEKALKSFDFENNKYSTKMLLERARMLEMTGTEDELESYIEQLLILEADSEKVTSFISGIRERQGKWVKVYELLKDCKISRRSSLSTVLRLCRAQIKLRMYLAAHHTASLANEHFEESSLAAGVLAETELLLDRPEAALQAVRKPRARRESKVQMPEIRALFESGRTLAGIEACKSSLITVPEIYSSYKDIPFVAPAESALTWHRNSIPSMEEFNEYALRLRQDNHQDSPFLKTLFRLWLTAFEAKASAATTDHDIWAAAGRNRQEKATALNLLTLLLCRFDKFDSALNAAQAAVHILPESSVLWQPALSLSRNDTKLLTEAVRHCPDDDDIWLAQLISVIEPQPAQSSATGNSPAQLTEEALSLRNISPAGLTRGADYLLRKGHDELAIRLASEAAYTDSKFLPAQLIALRCAKRANDRKLAVRATANAIAASLNPRIQLYKTYVELHSDAPNPEDSTLLHSLRELQKLEPDNKRWPPMLAYLRFLRGGWEDVRAFQGFSKSIDMGVTNKAISFMAAESSRRLGNPGRAAGIMRDMLASDPNNVYILNNLAYTLGSVAETPLSKEDADSTAVSTAGDDNSFIRREDAIAEAMSIVPKLIKLAPDNLAVLDTITFVLIEAEKYSDAEKALSILIEESKNNIKYKFKAAIHKARLQMISGNIDAAEKTVLNTLVSARGVPDEDIVRANTLLAKIVALQQEKRSTLMKTLRNEVLKNREKQSLPD